MPEKKFELTDLSTGKKSVAEIKSGTLGSDVLNIAHLHRDHGLYTFDPGFMLARQPTRTAGFIR